MTSYTIMIVDDESQMSELIRKFLHSEKYMLSKLGRGTCALSLDKVYRRFI